MLMAPLHITNRVCVEYRISFFRYGRHSVGTRSAFGVIRSECPANKLIRYGHAEPNFKFSHVEKLCAYAHRIAYSLRTRRGHADYGPHSLRIRHEHAQLSNSLRISSFIRYSHAHPCSLGVRGPIEFKKKMITKINVPIIL